MNALRSLLRDNPIFASLDQEERHKLAGQATGRDCASGEWLVHYGDVWPCLFVIESGEIAAIKESSEGRSLLVAEFRPGDVFWGLAFFIEGAPTPAGLLATADSKIHFWPRERILPVFLQNGSLSWELMLLMVQRMLQASALVEGLAFQPVAGRLAGWLLSRFKDAVDETVTRDMTLDEMAAQIGTTREMVCRLLYRFAEEGAVEINRTEFKISDSKMLQAYVAKVK
jgi:CRP-like cAMP-binding protein